MSILVASFMLTIIVVLIYCFFRSDFKILINVKIAGKVYEWSRKHYFGLFFVLFALVFSYKLNYTAKGSTLVFIVFSVILAVIFQFYFNDSIKGQKKGHYLLVIFFIILVVSLLVVNINTKDHQAFFSIVSDGSNINNGYKNRTLEMLDIKIMSWPYNDMAMSEKFSGSSSSSESNGGIYKEAVEYIYQLFVHYSWYISLIITLTGIIVTIMLYYNWRSNQRIKEEWEKLRGKTLKKETEINEAYHEIRDDVLNDPRLKNIEDKNKLDTFVRVFAEAQIENALQYAFLARQIQPEMKSEGRYTDQESYCWEKSLQYWKLAAYLMPVKIGNEKQHKEFVYGGLGNAYRGLANYGVDEFSRLIDNNGSIPDNNAIWDVVKGVLFYYARALAAYEDGLAFDPDNTWLINNRANLFMEIYRYKNILLKYLERLTNDNYEEKYNSYFIVAISKLPIIWKNVIKNGDLYYSSNELLEKAYSTLGDLVKYGITISDRYENRDYDYYRNYAIACYLKSKNKYPAGYTETPLYAEFLSYIEKYITCHKDGKGIAISRLKEDVDLKFNNAFEETKLKNLIVTNT